MYCQSANRSARRIYGRSAFNIVVVGWHDGVKFLANNMKCFVSKSCNLLTGFCLAVLWNFSVMQASAVRKAATHVEGI